MEKRDADLAGLYVTDDFIDVIVGHNSTPSVRKLQLSELELVCRLTRGGDDDDAAVFYYEDHGGDVEATFDAACRWILGHTSALRSIGVGCYGPFVTLDESARDDRDPAYGTLLQASHGTHLSNRSLVALVENGLRRSGLRTAMPLVTVVPDVAAAVIGEVYNRSRGVDGARRAELDRQTIAFVKVSRGIGAAFMRAATPWYGRYHPEMGQIQVPRWSKPTRSAAIRRELEVERTWVDATARNPSSLEALASARAIGKRFHPATFEQLQQKPAHMAWDREAWYLAQMAWMLTCAIAPHRVVFGGRVMHTTGLLARVKDVFETRVALRGADSFPLYPPIDEYLIDDSERSAEEVGRPGIIGALCIAAMEVRPSPLRSLRRVDR